MFTIVIDDGDLFGSKMFKSLDFPHSSWNRPESLCYNSLIILFSYYTEEYWDWHMSKYIYIRTIGI